MSRSLYVVVERFKSWRIEWPSTIRSRNTNDPSV